MFAWLFMRVSGVVLVILIFGHLFVNLWAVVMVGFLWRHIPNSLGGIF
jgi:succinate dehydrogenase hydrophobic anchor subunit